MSAISNIGSTATAFKPQRPDPAKMSEALFKKLDADGTGSIDATELSTAMSGAGKADPSAAAALLKGLDGNGDSQVSKEELSAGMQKLSDQFEAKFNASRTTHAADAFAALDKDGGGGIDKAELQSALGQSQDASKTDELFGKLDTNGDKTISKEELTTAMDSAAKSGGAEHAGGAHGAGGPRGGGGAQASSSADKQYDAADKNEDGTVSAEERLAYDALQAKRAEAAKGGSDAALDKLLVDLSKAYSGDNGQASASAVSVTA